MNGTLTPPTLNRMGSKKNPPADTPKADRHKPSRMFRVPTKMALLLDRLAEKELDSSASEQLKIAVREYLGRKGMLPGADSPPPKS